MDEDVKVDPAAELAADKIEKTFGKSIIRVRTELQVVIAEKERELSVLRVKVKQESSGLKMLKTTYKKLGGVVKARQSKKK